MSVEAMLKEAMLEPPPGTPILDTLRQRRAAVQVAVRSVTREIPTMMASEKRNAESSLEAASSYLKHVEARISDLEAKERREAAAAAHHVEIGTAETEKRWSVTSEPAVYRDPRKDPTSPSFFIDMRNAQRGDYQAMERLQRNERAAADREKRAGDMTTVAGAGGQFAPPAWLVDEFVALARPGRVAADLCNKQELPGGVQTINLPKVATGSTTAVQATQNSALSDTAMTTTSVSSGITTVGGKQIVSLQLALQSGIPFDRVILQDLAADYAKTLDLQVLYGSNASGQLRGWVGAATNNAFTTASPALTSSTAANSFYNKVLAAAAGIATTRYKQADAIVMHPNRWAWCLEALDSQVRPIISADGQSVNTAAVSTDVLSEGSVGTLGKIPVWIDANISTTANSATNQDETYVLRREDVFLWETPLRLDVFEQTYGDQASLLYRALSFSAAIPDRYSGAIQSIRGTGCIVPTL